MNVSRRTFLAATGLALAAAIAGCKSCTTCAPCGMARTEKLRAVLESGDRNYVFVTMHRGDWRHAPENSVAAIEGAIAMGADIVELDVATTKDGHYVLLHDGSLDRVSNGKGKSTDLTLAEISQYRLKGTDGKTLTDYKILTLEEAFALTKGKILVNIDKFPRDPEGIAKCAKKYGVEREVVLKGSFTPNNLKKKMGGEWASVLDGTFLYMPILDIDTEKGIERFEEWEKCEKRPFAYELCFRTEKLDVLTRLEAVQASNGPRIWINTLWDSLCAGHADDRGFGGDVEGSWGWCLGHNATMIQTDRPPELIRYLESKGRRNLDAALSATCKCCRCECK